MSTQRHSEGLKLPRLILVLSGVSPLFFLWAVRGSKLIADTQLFVFCAALIVLPNFFLWLRIHSAVKQNIRREIVIGSAEDHRDHLLVYLFAMLLPFYSIDTGSWRDVAALLAALAFVIFMFWHLNLHYMNIVFAIRGYYVFTLLPPRDVNPLTGRTLLVLITPRATLLPGDRVAAYRLSDAVYFEAKP